MIEKCNFVGKLSRQSENYASQFFGNTNFTQMSLGAHTDVLN